MSEGCELTNQLIEKVCIHGNINLLQPGQRIDYYKELCETIKVHPLTRPFDFLQMKDKTGHLIIVPYANKNCTDQLRRNHKVSIKIVGRELVGDVYVVTAQAVDAFGRTEDSMGVVSLSGTTKEGKPYTLQGDRKANAMMHAETKAKRRATLSLVGLGMLDQSELHSMKDVKAYKIDMETGELLADDAHQSSQASQEFIPKEKSTKAEKQEAPKPVEKIRVVREGWDPFAFVDSIVSLYETIIDENAPIAEKAGALDNLYELWDECTKDEKRDTWPLLSDKYEDLQERIKALMQKNKEKPVEAEKPTPADYASV